ncbi:DUF1592 domain-containing protein [Sorangium sp. So ce385]|uniref:DUF1592 domain-containing protein n=1 Tax=Sorangium sp. So ce385 TaxID=3133308 RepID=UPI003F5C89C8
MIRWQTWVLAGVASSLLACVGDAGGGDPEKDPPIDGDSCEQAQVGAPVLRRLSALELENSLRDIFPELGAAAWSGVRLGTDPTSKLGFTNDAEALQVGVQTAKELLGTAEDVADIVTAEAALATSLPCAATQPGPECAAEFVTRHGLRLFRRPVSEEEKSELLALHASVSGKSDFRVGLKWTLVSMIQSPHAFYRSEIGAPNGGRYELSQHELATALAYNYTGTTPTPELLDKAARGELGSPEALVEEARALLSSPRGHEAMSRFLQQWLSYGKVNGIAKENLPDFSTYGGFMQDETRLFLEEVLYTRGAGVTELLTAPYTFLNDQLSTFYGYGNVTGSAFQRVDRPAEWGVGLLAQGSILAGNSRMDGSSPTHRGLLVFERLLCGDVPPPPENIPAITKPDPGKTTTRARYEEIHISAEACNGCHASFDPTGFALEHFDETGRYRADEGHLPIDDSGYIVVKGEKRPVVGATGLAEALAGAPEVTECVSKLGAAYTYGGALGAECAISEAQQGLVNGQIGLVEYFAQLAGTEHMRARVRRE